MGFFKRHPFLSAFMVFILLTLPSAINTYWDLYQKFKGVSMPSLKLGYWLWLLPLIGLVFAGIIIWQGFRVTKQRSKKKLLGKHPDRYLQKQSFEEIIYEPGYDDLRESLISAKASAEVLLRIRSNAEIADPLSRIRGAIIDARDTFARAVRNLKKERANHPEYRPIIASLINMLQTGQSRLNRILRFHNTFGSSKSKIDDNARKIIRKIDEILDNQINQNSAQQRRRLDIPDSMDDRPRDFEIIWLEESFFLKGKHNDLHSYNSTDEKDKISIILRAKIRVSTFKQINVQSIALKIGSQEFPWDEKDVNVFGEPVTDEYQFEFPLNISRGKKVVRIKAIVDGKEYILPNHLIVDFPRKLN